VAACVPPIDQHISRVVVGGRAKCGAWAKMAHVEGQHVCHDQRHDVDDDDDDDGDGANGDVL